MPTATVEVRGLTKIYQSGIRNRKVLNNVDLDIYEGELFALYGQSGSGKSTLLNLLSAIDRADAGQILVNGTDIMSLSSHEQTLFRRDHIGIVFQFFNLIPTLTVLENITLPLELRGDWHHNIRDRGMFLLERVGLSDRADSFPDKLSGGEQQRVAIARALVHEPALVLADEPTGNLDGDTGERVLELLLELTRDAGRTLVMATHNPDITSLANRVGRIQSGELVVSAANLVSK